MFSKNSTKFQVGECETIWSGFNRKSYTLGSLFWVARQCNEKEYYKNIVDRSRKNLNKWKTQDNIKVDRSRRQQIEDITEDKSRKQLNKQQNTR